MGYPCITKGGQVSRVAPGLVAHYEALGWTVTDSGTDPLDAMTVPLLREHAAQVGIDLGGAKKKSDIVRVIKAWTSTTSTEE